MAAATIFPAAPALPHPTKPNRPRGHHGRLAQSLIPGESLFIVHHPTGELIQVQRILGDFIAIFAPDRFTITQEGREDLSPMLMAVRKYDLDHAVITERDSGQILRIGHTRLRTFFFLGHQSYVVTREADPDRRAGFVAARVAKLLEAR